MWKEVNLLSTNFNAKHTPSATLKNRQSILADYFFIHSLPTKSAGEYRRRMHTSKIISTMANIHTFTNDIAKS